LGGGGVSTQATPLPFDFFSGVKQHHLAPAESDAVHQKSEVG